ncbi:MAG: hypothetical protein U0234_01770 [Sandaracinus sp.]
MGRPLSRSLALVLTASLAGCGGARAVDRDPADYLAVGVDPAAEARTLEATLAESGLRPTDHASGEGWAAFAMTRSDGASLVRVVTRRGVVVALDETPSPVAAVRGVLGIDGARSGSDVDEDGRPDVLLVRTERERSCWMLVGLGDEGDARPLVVDTANLAADACLEDLRDVDGNATPEAIVRVRAHALARQVVPTADLPLERDATGIYRRVDAATRFVAEEQAARQARLSIARAAPDPEAVYTLAVELALVAFAAGDATDVQLAAFDEALGGVVLDVDLLGAVHFARARIAAGRIAE